MNPGGADPATNQHPLELGVLHPASAATWRSIAEVAGHLGVDSWAIVGGQMVMLHAIAAGLEPPRVTTDGDLVVDVRLAGRRAMRQVADFLLEVGFVMHTSPEGVSRFERGLAKLDLLAPDGLGSEPVITCPPGRAVQAPGATQALERTELRCVRFGDIEFAVRVPSLLGAIVAKAAATAIPATAVERSRHQTDLVLLLSIAARSNPRALRQALSKKDRQRLTSALAPLLADSTHSAWQAASSADDVRTLIRLIATLEN